MTSTKNESSTQTQTPATAETSSAKEGASSLPIVPRSPKRPPDLKRSVASLSPEDIQDIALQVKYRRVPEWRRKSNLHTRFSLFILRCLLYIALIPGMLGGVVVGASLELGASWNEAFKNVGIVSQTTIETYKTHFDLIKLSAQIILKLEGEDHADDMEMVAYAAEVRSKTSELSASLDRALADYLKKQVKRSKARRLKRESSKGAMEQLPPVTLSDILMSGIMGALCPLFLYWILGYFMNRWWLNVRARETIEFHKRRIERKILKKTPVRDLLK